LITTEAFSATAVAVRVKEKQSQYDASHNYFTGLLELALSKQELIHNWQVHIQQGLMTQERALHQLKLNQSYDVYWAGTTRERERHLRAIRIPLTKGLLGFRASLVHRDNIDRIDAITNRQQLLDLLPCQAAHWPDTEILLNAGFSVVSSPVYEGLFKQLRTKRCHFFPRGVAEATPEYLARREAYPEIQLYQNTIIHYPFPMYFFVSRNRQLLALAIEQGLEAAIDDGSFEKYLANHETTRHLFPLDTWLHARYFMLENPTLPDDTITTDTRYWIQPPRNAELIH